MMSKAEGNETQEAKEGKAADDESVYGKRRLILLFAICLLSPALVLFIRSLADRSVCDVNLNACIARCVEVYKDLQRRFQSQMTGETECKRRCLAQADACQTLGNAGFLAAGILAGGLACAVMLLSALESLISSMSGGSFSLEGERPRAAYLEPTYTEEEKVKQHERAQRWKFWKKNKELMDLVEVQCQECEVYVNVDSRWLQGSRGGMDSAICTRCRRIIAGVA